MKLSIGNGNEKIDGYTTLDIVPHPNVDIVADLNKGIPLDDNSVDELRAYSILDYVDNLPFVMEEIYRVCQPGALVHIKLPYFMSESSYRDPMKKLHLSPRSFECFDASVRAGYQGSLVNFKCDFRLDDLAWSYYPSARFLPFKPFLRTYFFNVAKSFYVRLRVNKP